MDLTSTMIRMRLRLRGGLKAELTVLFLTNRTYYYYCTCR
jgi:hypothetical protein